MALDMFLKLAGIEGESKDSVHKAEIDILAWSWGLSQLGTTHLGAGASASRVNFHDVQLEKYVDCSSMRLMVYCASGKHIPKATLTVRKAGGNAVEYFTVELEDVVISGVTENGADRNDHLTETILLNFGKCTGKYRAQMEDGTAGPVIPFGWDVKKNVST